MRIEITLWHPDDNSDNKVDSIVGYKVDNKVDNNDNVDLYNKKFNNDVEEQHF